MRAHHAGAEPAATDEEAPAAELPLDDVLPAAAAAAAPRRGADGVDAAALHFAERFLELLIDLLSQLPTRRFLHAVLAERQVLVKAKKATIFGAEGGLLYRQLLDQFEFYVTFPIDNHSGDALPVRSLPKMTETTKPGGAPAFHSLRIC